MKKYILQSLRLTGGLLLLCTVVYPLIILGMAQLSPNHGKGKLVTDKNGNAYFENIGQKFDKETYFHSRPSAVDYNAAGSGGSNKGPNDAEYLSEVQTRVAGFRARNPQAPVPVDMVTASGSGLDPHISVAAAMAQSGRVAAARGFEVETVRDLVNQYVEKDLSGPGKVNVLKINIALDNLAAPVQRDLSIK